VLVLVLPPSGTSWIDLSSSRPTAASGAHVRIAKYGGVRLHELEGKRKACWSAQVNGNWRLTFEFDGEDAILVDYEDYH
jgi:proteic killer suppression protein